RLEIDRSIESRKQSEQLAELRQLAVRDRDAVAHTGRAELLALHQCVEYRTFVLAGNLCGACGELLQGLLLAVDLQRRNNCIERDDVGKRHGTFPENLRTRLNWPNHRSAAGVCTSPDRISARLHAKPYSNRGCLATASLRAAEHREVAVPRQWPSC